MKQRLITSILMLIAAMRPVISQSEKKLLQRVAIRASCNVPKVLSSEAYRTSFNGLYDGGIKVTTRVFDNFCIGLGYDNALFVTTTQFRDPFGRNINTRQQMHNGVLSFYYDYMTGDKSFLAISLNTGLSYNKYTNVIAKYDSLYTNIPIDYIAGFIRPEVSINFLVEENFAFGIHLSYVMSLYTYDPKISRLDTYLKYSDYKNKSNVGWLSFGFGFYYGFKRKTKAAA